METPNTDKTRTYAQDVYAESSSTEYPIQRRGPPPPVPATTQLIQEGLRFTAKHGIAALIALILLFMYWYQNNEERKENVNFHEKVVVQLTLMEKTLEDIKSLDSTRSGSTAVYVGGEPAPAVQQRVPAATPLPKHRQQR